MNIYRNLEPPPVVNAVRRASPAIKRVKTSVEDDSGYSSDDLKTRKRHDSSNTSVSGMMMGMTCVMGTDRCTIAV